MKPDSTNQMIPILCCSRRKFWCCPFVSVDLASGAGKPEKFGLLWTVFVRSEQFLTNENSRGHPKFSQRGCSQKNSRTSSVTKFVCIVFYTTDIIMERLDCLSMALYIPSIMQVSIWLIQCYCLIRKINKNNKKYLGLQNVCYILSNQYHLT